MTPDNPILQLDRLEELIEAQRIDDEILLFCYRGYLVSIGYWDKEEDNYPVSDWAFSAKVNSDLFSFLPGHQYDRYNSALDAFDAAKAAIDRGITEAIEQRRRELSFLESL